MKLALTDGMRRPVSVGMFYAHKLSTRSKHKRVRRPATKKVSALATTANKKLQTRKLTIGSDLVDRSRHYCVLDEAGDMIREDKVATTDKALRALFGRTARSRIALETGRATRKTIAWTRGRWRGWRGIDPQLLRPVKHRSARAQHCCN
jgi:hypothetical protein